MAEAKFTKGPWAAAASCVIADGKPLVAFVNSSVETKDCEEDYANAKLTATAPEMYAMLEKARNVMLATYDVNDYPADGETDCDKCAAEIEKLLAKARGE